MAFMEQQITNKQTWLEIDGDSGITFVSINDADDLRAAYYGFTAATEATDKEDQETNMLDIAQDYYEGTVQEVSLKVGFGARLSAPGYLDCTEWDVFDTAEEAKAYLDENYPEEDEEETEE